MKESTLIEMKNKIESIGRILQHLINETTHLRELSVGTLEALKLMPGYDEAIKQLKESLTNKEEKTNGVVEQDTK
tara:strand:- start:150 stop:374 length:225 start_codon:yes stop_codon:yes gene_type:complete